MKIGTFNLNIHIFWNQKGERAGAQYKWWHYKRRINIYNPIFKYYSSQHSLSMASRLRADCRLTNITLSILTSIRFATCIFPNIWLDVQNKMKRCETGGEGADQLLGWERQRADTIGECGWFSCEYFWIVLHPCAYSFYLFYRYYIKNLNMKVYVDKISFWIMNEITIKNTFYG